MVSANVNVNIFKLFSQYWTQTTYVDESNYNLVERDQPGTHFSVLYKDVIKDLEETKSLVSSSTEVLPVGVKGNKLAIAEILQVYAMHVLVDTFGDVPYTESLDIDNLSPVYDNDQAIYDDLVVRLDTAIALIDTGAGTYGGYDLIYSGDASKWKKFANSLKLRMALRYASTNVAKATTMAQEAVASGVFTSNSDSATFDYFSTSDTANPIWIDLVQSGRSDFVAANTVVDMMNSLNDNRRTAYFDDNLGAGTYTGGIYGANNIYSSYTHIGAIFHTQENEGMLMDYAEVEFLLAEAAELTLVGAATDAATHYNNAITASFDYWGVSGIAAYLANTDVAYATATGTWQQKIATQKWLALFNRGFEGWSTYRQYGFPVMNTAAVSAEAVPRRYTYPIDEASINGSNYQAASTAMGGDLKTSKVFWDL